jgi:hypothetical protein
VLLSVYRLIRGGDAIQMFNIRDSKLVTLCIYDVYYRAYMYLKLLKETGDCDTNFYNHQVPKF